MNWKSLLVFWLTLSAVIGGLAAQTQPGDTLNPSVLETRIKRDQGKNWIISPALHWSAYRSVELSISRGYSWSSGGFPGTFSQYGLGLEAFYRPKTASTPNMHSWVVAPKISCELDPLFPPLCLSRMNLLVLSDFKHNTSVKYRHEVGLSYLGIVNLTYGICFNLSRPDYLFCRHSLNLQWNIFAGKRNWDSWD